MNRIAFYHIETLLWIARLGTFSAAAERLNTTQPTVSARIREMENTLGYPLFKREGRNMQLTVQSRQLVSDLEALWVRAENILIPPDSLEKIGGTLRLGCGEIPALFCLPGLLKSFTHDLPRVQVEVDIDITINLERALEFRGLDIAIIVGPVKQHAFEGFPIGSSRLSWFVNAEQHAALQEAPSSKFLLEKFGAWALPRPSHLYEEVRAACTKLGATSAIIHTCTDVRMLIEMVVTGAGMGMLPERLVKDQIDSKKLIKVIPESFYDIDFYAAIRKGENDRVTLAAFERAKALKF